MTTYITTSPSTRTISRSTFPPQARGRVAPKRRERSSLDRRPRACSQVEYEPQIMQAQKPQTEDLVLGHEVPDVRAREPLAGRAAAFVIQRTRVAHESGVAD